MDKDFQPIEKKILDYIRIVRASNFSGIARQFDLHHSGIRDLVGSLEKRNLVKVIETKQNGVKIVIPVEEEVL